MLVPFLPVSIDEESYRIGPCWAAYRVTGQLSEIEALDYIYHRLKQVESPVLLDIGAADGQYSLLATYLPRMLSYAFEPVPAIFDVLRKNIAMNALGDRVMAINVAISDVDTMGVINVPTSDRQYGLSTLGSPRRFDETASTPVPCKISKLDSIVGGEVRPYSITVVKIDTEGCELKAIKGAERTLKTYHPDIMFERNDVNASQFGYNSDEIIKLLMDWGWVDFRYLDGENVYCRYGK